MHLSHTNKTVFSMEYILRHWCSRPGGDDHVRSSWLYLKNSDIRFGNVDENQQRICIKNQKKIPWPNSIYVLVNWWHWPRSLNLCQISEWLNLITNNIFYSYNFAFFRYKISILKYNFVYRDEKKEDPDSVSRKKFFVI